MGQSLGVIGGGPSIFVGGPGRSYKCIGGLVSGFYRGDLIGDSFILNASINANVSLVVNGSVLYNDYLVVKVLDDNNLPYYNNTLKVHIFNKNYDGYLEALIDDKGFAKIKLPSNLTKGEYNINYSLKIVKDSYMKYDNYCLIDLDGGVLCYDYEDHWIKNSSLSVLKSNASLNSSNLNCVYGSKYLTAKLVDNRGNVIGNSSVLFKVYVGNGKYKSYSVKTDSNGVATLKHNFKPGKYVVKIESTNQNYDVKSVKSTLKVSKAPVTIKAPKVTKKYHKKAYFKINIMNKATKKVIKGLKIRIKVYTGKKYKTYSVKTNSKGVASLSTKSFEKGKHKVIITSDNDCYSIGKKGNLIVIK